MATPSLRAVSFHSVVSPRLIVKSLIFNKLRRKYRLSHGCIDVRFKFEGRRRLGLCKGGRWDHKNQGCVAHKGIFSQPLRLSVSYMACIKLDIRNSSSWVHLSPSNPVICFSASLTPVVKNTACPASWKNTYS